MKNKSYNILIDANSLIGNKSGVGNFTSRLIESMAKVPDQSFKIHAYYFNFLGLKKIVDLPRKDLINYIEIKYLPTKILNILHRFKIQIPLEFFINTKIYKLIIFPNFVAVPNLRKIPYVVAVHDLTYEDCPEYLPAGNLKYLKNFVGKSVKKSSLVITISEFTKKRLLSHYGKGLGLKTIVIPLPYEPGSHNNQISDKIKNLAKKPFLLYVGTIEPRKNISNLVKAFDSLPEKILDKYQLILAGGAGWKNAEIYESIDKAKKATIILTGYISDSERDFLYSKTSAVCFVSHYEGFGIPILEAFHYSKPILLSDIDVFREVAVDQATYCNPNNINSIKNGLEIVIKSQAPRNLVHSSWEENAKKIIDNIEKII